MSLDRAIAAGHEHRRTYAARGRPGEHDVSCRPHGGGRRSIPCPWCVSDRLVHVRRQRAAERVAMQEMTP